MEQKTNGMKKFINDPETVVDDMLEGLLIAHSDQLKSIRSDNRALVRADSPIQGKVAIATGGGSGHLPLFLGYVGKGMLDGVAVGDIFASPSSQQMLDVTRSIHGGEGVLYIYGNYGGDVMNFDMAAELADLDGIRVETVVATDDAASMPKGYEHQRRGVAGMFYLYKLAAAKAEQFASLDEVKRIAEKANSNVRTMGVALTPCILPAVGRPTFEIGEGEMEIGMGIHGEPGIQRGKLQTADEVAQTLVTAILQDMPIDKGCDVSVLINGLGATPLEELYIFYRSVHKQLEEKGIHIYNRYIGEYATSLEMAGLSISILRLDDELRELLDAPFATPFRIQN
ncbi:dihydroxyacetone kinase subunit DhaK [Paenibacillus naphthalenovorans]|uniref:PTS-dependent dihydroxyacetone kinase, dihydroxyacetone-binding subunit DhaK n=2 Tax=Paenibacillus naphthalenovorans TaxID=162209 RepID=A0A0U2IMT9_9BACL|nr:dihydroxyacetone kinase subunit DhaK [Paenibacillus naphthalenovorans]ALS23355.1 PTS-dependent dihydroxyacetone kinase, dihydroxyacetone-binding subunit DhaK [Paenibacillus naphthalenovorans]GCL72835.1 dihydroxyacetone kinase subunit DhaK [Paenibacillus naphthalenovorans]